MPSESSTFTPSSILFRPRRSPNRTGRSGLGWRRRVPPPGPIGLFRRTFIAIAGLATGKGNIEGPVPLLKPAARHSVTVSRSGAPAHSEPTGLPAAGRESGSRWRPRSCGRCCCNCRVRPRLRSGRCLQPPPAVPASLLPFKALTGTERAALALTVLPHAALAFLILAAIRLRQETPLILDIPLLPTRLAPRHSLGFTRPTSPAVPSGSSCSGRRSRSPGRRGSCGSPATARPRLAPVALSSPARSSWPGRSGSWCSRRSPRRCCFAATCSGA